MKLEHPWQRAISLSEFGRYKVISVSPDLKCFPPGVVGFGAARHWEVSAVTGNSAGFTSQFGETPPRPQRLSAITSP